MEIFLGNPSVSSVTSANAGLPGGEIEQAKVSVLAAGAFGMAMATIAARRGHHVVVYARDQEVVNGINQHNRHPRVFPEHELPPNITATTSVTESTMGARIVMSCLPAQRTPDFIAEHKDVIPEDSILVITAKGLYLKTRQLLSTAILEGLQRDQPLAFLSGPSFAKELMDNAPSAVVVASKYLYHAVAVQRLLSTVSFRIYSSQDVIGVQLGGALKNPLAIGAGMVQGAGLGMNTLSFYLTRSSLELQKLCVGMGGQPITISGLAGIGDLMLTAFGDLSRNRAFGERLMEGNDPKEMMKHTTVEGVATAEVAVYFAEQCGLDLPLFRAVNAMVKGHIRREDLQNLLMNRPLRTEV